MDVQEAVRRRRSARAFEPDTLRMKREEIEDLIAEACQAPSEFNLQPWRFIVVRDSEKKQVLYECAFRQEKIREASAIIIVCGDRMGYEVAPRIVEDHVAKGNISPDEARAGAESILRQYRDSEQARLFLAIRNPCLAAMSLMLLATERGIATCPMGGFSEIELRRAFHIPDNIVPVMLVAIGMSSTTSPQPQRGMRLPVQDIVFHEDMGSRL